MKKIILLLTVSLMVITQVMADDGVGLVIKKTAPEEIVKGDVLPVTISIINSLTEGITVTVRESFGDDAEIIDGGGLKRKTPQKIISAPPYYECGLIVDANSEKSITYKIKPLYFGRFRIPATKVYTPRGEIKSDTLIVLVKCNRNNICEIEEDENALTCPEDCSPDERDDLCNPLNDGVCDPDCREGKDPDCGVTSTTATIAVTTTTKPVSRCGDNICAGENYGNCPLDCPSGGVDGYCDGLRDSKCDPDCLLEEDPDCKKPVPIHLWVLLVIILVVVIVIVYKKWLNTGD
ncbi:MAG: hypothetical protein U9Q22_03740 [Candidatus Altiarchaeota archaeon]|nr:hypothetical protein [Candidatus Altiarchaeota archaeon]